MVVNLPAEARAQWRRVSEARSPEEKLRELQRFLSLIPRHKGTKNLIKQVNRQIASLREEIEERRKKKVGRYISEWNRPKHGVARLALVTMDPSLYHKLMAGLEKKGAVKWVFTPKYKIMGDDMLQFQAVFLPPLNISDSLDYRIFNFIKTVDLVIAITARGSEKEILDRLFQTGIDLYPQKGQIEIIKTHVGGIRIVGSTSIPRNDIIKLLNSYRIYNAIVKINGDISLSDIENKLLNIRIAKPGFIVSIDKNSIYIIDIIKDNEYYIEKMKDKKHVINFILKKLKLIRVFTKPNKYEKSDKPVILKEKSCVGDLARMIHSRLEKNFKYAIVIRNGIPIKVSKNFILKDKDIVEIRA